jgi:hypothetical protein
MAKVAVKLHTKGSRKGDSRALGMPTSETTVDDTPEGFDEVLVINEGTERGGSKSRSPP